MKDQRKEGVLLAYLGIALNTLIQLLYTPVMLRLLGQSEYGVYQIATSTVGYLGLLNFGFHGAYVHFYAKYKSAGEEKEIARLNGLFLVVMCFLGGVCLAAGFSLTHYLSVFFGEKLLAEEISLASVLIKVLVVNMSLTFPLGLFDCFMVARERFRMQKMVYLIKTVCNPFLTLPLLLMGYGSEGIVLVTMGLTVLTGLLQAWYCIGKLNLRFSFVQIRFGMLREIWVFCAFIFLNQIVDQVNWSVDKVLIGSMIGSGAVAVYAVAGLLNGIYMQFSTAISNVFLPKVNVMAAEGAPSAQFTDLFTKVGRIQLMVLGLVLSGYVFFGQSFLDFYVGEGYEGAYAIGLCLLVPVTIPLIQNLGIEIQRAKNRHKFRSILYLCASIVNVGISIPLIRCFGGTGAAMGTMISLVVCNILIMNAYYHRVIGLDMWYFWREICRLVPAFCIPLLVGIVIKWFFPLDSILFFLIGVGVYTLLYAGSIYFLGMNMEEKELIDRMLRRSKA